MYMLQGKLLNNAYIFNSRDHTKELNVLRMSPSIVEINEGIAHVGNMWSRSCYLGEFKSLWEMQDVENLDQINEGNNEEGKNISM
jgi:hypothetical protein